MKKAKVAATLGAVALIGAIGIGSTFAYLTSQTGTVTNTFTVGNVNFDQEAGLKESLVEQDKETGEYIDKDGKDVWSTDGNEYTDVYPGQKLIKDPTVKLAEGSQDAWVFAKITFDNRAAFKEVEYNTNWTDVTEEYKTANGIEGEINYVVYANTEDMTAGVPSTIFNSVTLADDITSETTIGKITVKACAVQKAGFASYTEAISEAVFE